MEGETYNRVRYWQRRYKGEFGVLGYHGGFREENLKFSPLVFPMLRILYISLPSGLIFLPGSSADLLPYVDLHQEDQSFDAHQGKSLS